jgi:hypothetical protein
LAFEWFAVWSAEDERTRQGLSRARTEAEIFARAGRRRFQEVKDASPDQAFCPSIKNPRKPAVCSDDRAVSVEYYDELGERI